SAGRGRRSGRDIILVGDGQRLGWADQPTLNGWEDLASKRFSGADNKPNLWVVNLDPHRPENPPNWSMGPISASRAVVAVNQEVTFRTSLRLTGQADYTPPYDIRLEVHGKCVKTIGAPREAKLRAGRGSLPSSHKFPSRGSPLGPVPVEPAPPPEKRGARYVVKDYLPIDNHRDFALEVVEPRPVL